MDISDKILTDNSDSGSGNRRCCPAHYLPHKLPDGEPITDEPCHTHRAEFRRLHHNLFCLVLRCPHFEFMREKTKQLLKEI